MNKPFPDLSFKSLSGKSVKLSKLRGKVVVINWWSTSCGPCIQEMPMLNQLVKDNLNKKEVVFYAVARNKPEEVERFLKKRDFNYQHGVYNEKLVEAFGEAMPVNVVIDKKGNVVYYGSGFSNSEIVNKKEMERFRESINKALNTL